MSEKYNGWTNYATWRVQLELVDDYVQGMFGADEDWLKEQREMSTSDMADCIEDYVTEVLENDTNDEVGSIVLSYAMAFIDNVNWYELAEHALETLNQGVTA